MTDLSIIIVNWNTRPLLLDCLESIRRTVKGKNLEIWVVDNGSTDGSVEAVAAQFPGVRIIANRENLGFAKANNQALARMKGTYALLLNSDTVLKEGAVDRLIDFMEKSPRTAIACGQLLNEDGSRQNSIANFPTVLGLMCNETVLRLLLPRSYPSKRRTYTSPLRVDSCIGACMIVRKKAIDEVGPLDDRYFFYFEETDWARMMREAGWQTCFVPDAEIFHLQGKSVAANPRGRLMFHRSRLLYFRKWHPRLYPALTLICLGRVAVNTVTNLAATLLTAGLAQSVRNRFLVNGKLLLWYLQGCP